MTRVAHLAFALLLVGCRKPPPDASADAAPSRAITAPMTSSEAARPPIVLRVARALSPRTGAVIAPAFVTLRGSTIAAVDSTAPSEPFDDLGDDSTLLPGLIDAHAHLLHLVRADDEHSEVVEAITMSDADRALRGVAFAREMLESGFTTVRDLGNAGRGADLALRRAIAKGWVVGPELFVSSRAIAPPFGQFPRLRPEYATLVDDEYAIVRSEDDARRAARELLAAGADWIKLIVDQGPSRTLTREEIAAAVEIAHGQGRKVAAHVLTDAAAARAVDAGVDSLEHAYEISDATLREMARRRTYLVPTDYPRAFYDRFAVGPEAAAISAALDAQRASAIDRLSRARRAGVPIAAGSDAYVDGPPGHRGKAAALIFRAYAEAGLTPLEIVRAATSNASDLLGLPASRGAIEAGGPADLVVVRGDPLANVDALSSVLLVVRAGRIVHDVR
jgi:imidazolonepropionase-like amidohydrolase